MTNSLREINLAAALALADANFRLFPARPTFNSVTRRWNKPPYVNGWQSVATTDGNQITSWWSQHPDALPAMCCETFVVVDADRPPGGPDGVAALAGLVRKHGDWPNSPSILTPSNGEHHYFAQTDPPLGNGTGQLPPGIDVRGSGGFIISPGAVLPDGTGWSLAPGHSSDFPPLPEWLEQLIRADERHQSTATISADLAATARETAYAQAALRGGIAEIQTAPIGRRNSTLNSVALRLGRMVARGWIDRADVESSLLSASSRLVNEDGRIAVKATIKSGLDAGCRKPHPDLADRTR